MKEVYYDKEYFEFQKRIGAFGGIANLFKFEKYISSNDDVMDFGCGGGFLLKNIKTNGRKVGVEINEAARETAKTNGISELYPEIKFVPDDYVDIIISNHALEHVDNPVYILKEMKRICRRNGKIILVVPHEVNSKVKENDINMHLYTWSPQNLRNLFVFCGYNVLKSEHIDTAWMPNYLRIQQLLGWRCFHILCRLYSKRKNIHQTIVVAQNSD